VERARVLVRLNADQRDQSETRMALKAGEKRWQVDAGVGLVDEDVEAGIKSPRLIRLHRGRVLAISISTENCHVDGAAPCRNTGKPPKPSPH
jgi:hypothetical protein